MRSVEFSVSLPSCTEGLCYPIPFASREVIEQMARHAEALGYDGAFANDHLSTQRYVGERFDTPPNYYDPFISLSFAAAATEKIRLGTAITVLPMREPTVLAKQVMTLDQFSGGRLILGVGLGAYREEFESVNPRLAQDANRGEMVTEGIEALQTLFSQRRATYEGKYWAFKDVEMYPKPYQEPLPIWVGGNSRAGAQRAGRLGQGWLSAVMPPAQIREFVTIIHEAAEEAGRDPQQITIAPQFIAHLGKTDEEARATFRQSGMYHHILSLKQSTLKDQDLSRVEEYNLIGTPDTILEKINQFTEAGVTHFCSLVFSTSTVEETLDQMQWFAEEVMGVIGD